MNKMKRKAQTYYTVETAPKSNKKTTERGIIDTRKHTNI